MRLVYPVILVPVLGRPHRIAPLLESIRKATPQPYRVLFIASPNDHRVHAAIEQAKGEYILVDGNYAQKINTGIEATSESLIFTGASDLNFKPGWLEAARRLMDHGIGVVGTNDECNQRVIRGEHSTHSLVARWYAKLGTIDEPGKLLHEGYDHNFCDDELVQTAKSRDAYAHAHGSVVQHLHPLNGTAPDDEVYQRGQENFRLDHRLFRRRCRLWQR